MAFPGITRGGDFQDGATHRLSQIYRHVVPSLPRGQSWRRVRSLDREPSLPLAFLLTSRGSEHPFLEEFYYYPEKENAPCSDPRREAGAESSATGLLPGRLGARSQISVRLPGVHRSYSRERECAPSRGLRVCGWRYLSPGGLDAEAAPRPHPALLLRECCSVIRPLQQDGAGATPEFSLATSKLWGFPHPSLIR